MRIVHELNQLDYGGVEKVIRNIAKFDNKNEHIIVAYKDGPFRQEFEKINVKIMMSPKEGTIDIEDVDLIHIHSGGGISQMAMELGEVHLIIETIHSPIRSPMPARIIRQRVGVTDTISRMNENCRTIYNGIDFSDIVPTKTPQEIKKELGIPDNRPIIGRLGRIGKDKCLEEWLLTCYHLQKEIDFIPLIVGAEVSNLNGYIGKLKLMAASLPVKNVVWAGHHDDIANYLQIMDVFLYPSPTEGFGLVFAEAMYIGIPVVTYRNDVTMEVCGGYSVLMEKSIKGLVEGIKKALNVNIRDEIIPLAQEWVTERFGADRMAYDYQQIYEEVVNVGVRVS